MFSYSPSLQRQQQLNIANLIRRDRMRAQLRRARLLELLNLNIAHFADQFEHILRLCFKQLWFLFLNYM